MSSVWQGAGTFPLQHVWASPGEQGEPRRGPRTDTDSTMVGSANPCCPPFIGSDSQSIAPRWAGTGAEGGRSSVASEPQSVCRLQLSFPFLVWVEGHMMPGLVPCGNSADIRGAGLYQVLSPLEEGRGGRERWLSCLYLPDAPCGGHCLVWHGGGSGWSAFFAGVRRRADSAQVFPAWVYVRSMFRSRSKTPEVRNLFPSKHKVSPP